MLLKLAWRNIWRNSRRSMIVLISIIVGMICVILYDALSVGMIHQMLNNQVGAHVSHIQIHKNGFNDNKLLQNYLPEPDSVAALLARQPQITAFSRRAITYGIISSPTSSSGISLIGIEPEQESQVTDIKKMMIEGSYLGDGKRDIVVGKALAEKLDVGIGDKVVAMASRIDGSIGSDVFRISGLFETFNSEFDKVSVYISLANAQKMLAFDNRISEIAMVIHEMENAASVKKVLAAKLNDSENPPQYEVLTFRELLPLLVMQVDVYRESISVFYGIVALAMLFGIVNTMLMSVLERTQEFGVLMAMGMKNRRIFNMVLLEAFLLSVLGTLVGIGLSYVFYLPLANSGIDLSAFSAGLDSFGTGSIIYPVYTLEGLLNGLLIVPIAAVIGAVYPARKAMKLVPIEAIRKV